MHAGSMLDRSRLARASAARNDWRVLKRTINITDSSIMHARYQYMKRDASLCINVIAVHRCIAAAGFGDSRRLQRGVRGPILRPGCFIKYLRSTVLLSDTLQNSCRLARYGRRLKSPSPSGITLRTVEPEMTLSLRIGE